MFQLRFLSLSPVSSFKKIIYTNLTINLVLTRDNRPDTHKEPAIPRDRDNLSTSNVLSVDNLLLLPIFIKIIGRQSFSINHDNDLINFRCVLRRFSRDYIYFLFFNGKKGKKLEEIPSIP